MKSHRRARLIYDSARTVAGVFSRSAPTTERTLLFRADPLSVDLVAQRGSGALCCLHGQVVDGGTGSPVSGVTVQLDDAEVSQTDEYGEFSVSSLEPADGHRLVIGTPDHELVLRIPHADAGDVA